MKLSRLRFALVPFAAALLALSACDVVPQLSATPTPPPTATLMPTPLPPSPTVVAPSPTPSEQPTSTPLPPSPTQAATETATPPPAASGKIVYLDPDGVTVRRVNPDGSGTETLFTIDKPAKGSVVALSGDRSGEHLLYAVSQGPEDERPVYYLAALGAIKKLMPFFGTPRWSPHGSRIAGESLKPDGSQGPVYVYNVSTGKGDALQADGLPDFYPNGSKLVYAWQDNVYSYDLLSGHRTQLTNLPNNDQDAWVVQEAHVLPAGDKIIFYGGQFKKGGEPQLGASGNGQQWWSIPRAGGDPIPLGEPGGNYTVAYANNPVVNSATYIESAHSSACISVYSVHIIDGASAAVSAPDLPELQETQNGAAWVRGVTWSPSGTDVAFDVQPYSCSDAAGGRTMQTPHVYTWHTGQGGSDKPVPVVEGTFPVWTR